MNFESNQPPAASDDGQGSIVRQPWDCDVDALTGVVIHQAEA